MTKVSLNGVLVSLPVTLSSDELGWFIRFVLHLYVSMT